MRRTIEPGEIVETLNIEGLSTLSFDVYQALLYHLTDFSIDVNANVRLGRGIISMGPANDSDFKYVPSERYEVNSSPWNSHQDFLEICLPNPAIDFEYYQTVRQVFITEINIRLMTDMRRWRLLVA